jgi:hypothetical protein
MNNILLLALVLRIDEMRERRDRGQGTLEYVGMIAVAALLIGVVVTAFADGSSIGEKVSNAIETVTSIG